MVSLVSLVEALATRRLVGVPLRSTDTSVIDWLAGAVVAAPTLAQALRHRRRHGFGLWSFHLRQSDEPVGVCGLLRTAPPRAAGVELVGAVAPARRRQGYGREMAAAVVAAAREPLALPEVLAHSPAGNGAAGRLLQALGFESAAGQPGEIEQTWRLPLGRDAEPLRAPIPRTVDAIDWSRWRAVDPATLVFVVRAGQVLLIRKKRGLGAGKINGPGGRLEPGETPVDCALREAAEELRIVPRGICYAGDNRFQFVDGYSIHVHVFVASDLEGVPTETDEATPLWAPVEALPFDQMWEDDRLWLPLALSGERFTARYLFDGERMIDHRLDRWRVLEPPGATGFAGAGASIDGN